MRVLVLLFCLVSSFTRPAAADTRVALVIGNAAYEKGSLANPTVDVDLIRPALERMGFAVEVVKGADLASLDRAITAFTSRVFENPRRCWLIRTPLSRS